jgi:nucleotide-binding universal stress UspA family protein
MKSILVPFDFSDCATNALEYAAAIAAHTKAKITLFHSFLITIDTTSPVIMPRIIDEMIVEELKIGEIKLQNAITTLRGLHYFKDDHHLDIQTSVRHGNFIDIMEELGRSTDYDLIVMGTRGATGVKEVFMGSNTVNVIEKVKKPLIVVPEDAKYHGFRHVVYATALLDKDIEVIEDLQKFAEIFDAELTCLHINKSDNQDIAQFKMNYLEDNFRFTPISKLNFQLIKDKSAEKGLMKFLNDYHSDLIAIMPQERDFIKGFFHSSLTKRLAFHSVTPLLVVRK